MITRYCEDYFTKYYKKTAGVDFYQKRLELPDDVNVSMQLWDVDGSALSGKMLELYVYEASAIVFVYDVTNMDTFREVEQWNRAVSIL